MVSNAKKVEGAPKKFSRIILLGSSLERSGWRPSSEVLWLLDFLGPLQFATSGTPKFDPLRKVLATAISCVFYDTLHKNPLKPETRKTHPKP